jgi:hypothetical protein
MGAGFSGLLAPAGSSLNGSSFWHRRQENTMYAHETHAQNSSQDFRPVAPPQVPPGWAAKRGQAGGGALNLRLASIRPRRFSGVSLCMHERLPDPRFK